MQTVRSDTGFSLVEMMMVVAIIGLMTSAVVLVMPSKDDGLKDMLHITERAFIVLSRQSVMTGRVYGARFSHDGFEPYVLTDDGWKRDTMLLKPETTMWRPITLASLEVAGGEIDVVEEESSPHVWFLPTSETVEFKLRLGIEGQVGFLEMDAVGKTKVGLND